MEAEYIEADTIPGFSRDEITSSLSEGKYIVINQSHSEPLVGVGLVPDNERVLLTYGPHHKEKFMRVTPAAVIDFLKKQPSAGLSPEELGQQKYEVLNAIIQQLRNTVAQGPLTTTWNNLFMKWMPPKRIKKLY